MADAKSSTSKSSPCESWTGLLVIGAIIVAAIALVFWASKDGCMKSQTQTAPVTKPPAAQTAPSTSTTGAASSTETLSMPTAGEVIYGDTVPSVGQLMPKARSAHEQKLLGQAATLSQLLSTEVPTLTRVGGGPRLFQDLPPTFTRPQVNPDTLNVRPSFLADAFGTQDVIRSNDQTTHWRA